MQKIKKFFTKGMQKNKDFGEWLLSCIPPRGKVVEKVLESFKNKIKNCMKRVIVWFNQHNPNLL